MSKSKPEFEKFDPLEYSNENQFNKYLENSISQLDPAEQYKIRKFQRIIHPSRERLIDINQLYYYYLTKLGEYKLKKEYHNFSKTPSNELVHNFSSLLEKWAIKNSILMDVVDIKLGELTDVIDLYLIDKFGLQPTSEQMEFYKELQYRTYERYKIERKCNRQLRSESFDPLYAVLLKNAEDFCEQQGIQFKLVNQSEYELLIEISTLALLDKKMSNEQYDFLLNLKKRTSFNCKNSTRDNSPGLCHQKLNSTEAEQIQLAEDTSILKPLITKPKKIKIEEKTSIRQHFAHQVSIKENLDSTPTLYQVYHELQGRKVSKRFYNRIYYDDEYTVHRF